MADCGHVSAKFFKDKNTNKFPSEFTDSFCNLVLKSAAKLEHHILNQSKTQNWLNPKYGVLSLNHIRHDKEKLIMRLPVFGYFVFVIAIFGLFINVASIVLLIKKNRPSPFHQLLKILAVYDVFVVM
ncbi:hypothetical protein TCAL_16685 [Tigriopus californicus]|uniref:G-protein coupled receptors family 1 profile domain-containing protein n=1 Tax=Tigriopus californicus TaxID=6832 RepID=A0A553PKJ3_TIGCA|nr:hypothetical protein TCAL_16685 [Tigriopus californicus]